MFSFDFFKSVLGLFWHGKSDVVANDIVINSIEVKKGDCFIGLIGLSKDGGEFFEDALRRGATVLIIHKIFEASVLAVIEQYSEAVIFFVDDTKVALLQVAKKWRSYFCIPIIAVTGSVGKTTTKEMIKSVFEKSGMAVCATKSSMNGTIGLPLSVLQLRMYHNVAIFEIGIQKIGEMDIMLDVLQSVFYGIVTTILPAHMEYLKDFNTIIQEKMKLQFITSNTFFIDYKFKKYTNHKNMITIGNNESADFFYQFFATKMSIDIRNKKKYFMINALYHDGLRHCLAIAFAVTFVYMISPKFIMAALENFERISGRFSVHRLTNGAIIINDSFNAANQYVMLTSIEAFEFFPVNKKKIVILGDMLEQGEDAAKNHCQVIERLNAIDQNTFELVYYVGENFYENKIHNIRQNVNFAKNFLDIADEIYNLLDKEYCFLFKSSRGMMFFHYICQYLEKNSNKK